MVLTLASSVSLYPWSNMQLGMEHAWGHMQHRTWGLHADCDRQQRTESGQKTRVNKCVCCVVVMRLGLGCFQSLLYRVYFCMEFSIPDWTSSLLCQHLLSQTAHRPVKKTILHFLRRLEATSSNVCSGLVEIQTENHAGLCTDWELPHSQRQSLLYSGKTHTWPANTYICRQLMYPFVLPWQLLELKCSAIHVWSVQTQCIKLHSSGICVSLVDKPAQVSSPLVWSCIRQTCVRAVQC